MSMRIAASCAQPLQLRCAPLGAWMAVLPVLLLPGLLSVMSQS